MSAALGSRSPNGQRVVLAPATRRDGEVACRFLRAAGIDCAPVESLAQMAEEIRLDVGALVLTDLALMRPEFAAVAKALAEQQAWSDLPIVLMASEGGESINVALRQLHNVTILERPSSVKALIGAVQAALRARGRQFQIRHQLEALRQADDALRAADRRKDEFLATLAHELRNPLAPMRSALQIMERGLDSGAGREKLLSMMDRQMNVMVRLIDDLLDVARISSGKVVLQRERLDLRRVVEVAVEGAEPGILAAGHRLDVNAPDQPVWVLGDATRLAQIVGNVLNNATKYTPAGGHIRIAVGSDDNQGTISVVDDGVGIPPALLGRVFDMFAQVNRTLDRAQGGLGIGLSLVQRLVEMHGGRVTAASAGVDAGSRFTVSLPLIEAPDRSNESDASSATQAVRGDFKVLVVDDNRDAADLLTMLIAADGYQTRTEYGGDAAIAAADEFRPRVVFCDIGMPDVNGHQVAQRLRTNPAHATAVLVAVTGWGTEEDKRQSQRAGFDFHLTKPVDSQALAAVFEQL